MAAGTRGSSSTGRATTRLRWPPAAPVARVDWPLIILIVLLAGYWIFAWSLERVNGTVVIASVLYRDLSPADAAALTLPRALTLAVELFHPRVLRHLIPVVAGWWLAVQAAISLMQVLYNCPDRATAAEFLRRQRRNRAGGEAPYAVDPKKLAEAREESFLLRVGGPVRVQIPAGHAAVTERNARFLRVLPPGAYELGSFEYLMSVVDLQPQDRGAKDFPLRTREGIEVRADASITFRIDPGDEVPSRLRPYPFQEEAVRRAAYAAAVVANGQVSSWDDSPIGKVKGALAGLVEEYALDELLSAESPGILRTLTQAVTQKVRDALRREGVVPMRVRILRLSPPEEASKQYTEYWVANRQKQDQISKANGTAALVEQQEVLRAEAELTMIQAIVEGVRRAQQEAGTNLSGYLLAMRLVEALQGMVNRSSTALTAQPPIGDASQILTHIDQLTRRLAQLEDRMQPPADEEASSSSA